MAVFLIVGSVGIALLLIALLFGDLLDGVLDAINLEGGILSTEVIASFLAAFGFGGALMAGAVGTSAPIAAVAGLGFGALAGTGAFAFTRAVMGMRTDPTPRSVDLVGKLGTVVTRVPAGGLGEVVLHVHGQRLKVSAKAEAPIPSGTEIVVVSVLSPTAVQVTEAGLELQERTENQ